MDPFDDDDADEDDALKNLRQEEVWLCTLII